MDDAPGEAVRQMTRDAIDEKAEESKAGNSLK